MESSIDTAATVTSIKARIGLGPCQRRVEWIRGRTLHLGCIELLCLPTQQKGIQNEIVV